MKIFISCISILLANFAVAGPIAGGGVPPTEFEFDREAIQTILGSEIVNDILREKGSILNIVNLEDSQIIPARPRGIYLVKTRKCELAVQFQRTCNFERNGGLPDCTSKAVPVLEQSFGDCN